MYNSFGKLIPRFGVSAMPFWNAGAAASTLPTSPLMFHPSSIAPIPSPFGFPNGMPMGFKPIFTPTEGKKLWDIPILSNRPEFSPSGNDKDIETDWKEWKEWKEWNEYKNRKDRKGRISSWKDKRNLDDETDLKKWFYGKYRRDYVPSGPSYDPAMAPFSHHPYLGASPYGHPSMVQGPGTIQPMTRTGGPMDMRSEMELDAMLATSAGNIDLDFAKKYLDTYLPENGKSDMEVLTRREAVWLLLCAKKVAGITFTDIAKKINRSEFWTTSALLGQQPLTKEESETIIDMLQLDKRMEKKYREKIILLLTEPPLRGSLFFQTVPTDPTIYRLYEIIQVYGTTFKALLNEKFGDGIMSAVDVRMNLDKSTDDNGDRVKFTIDGAFEPYSKY